MDNFTFSQSSLQDYVDCPRRFELRYCLRRQWPGFIPEEPDEARRSILLGNRFHLLCHQYFSGIPDELIRQSILDEALLEWWQNFIAWKPTGLSGGQYLPEITLHTRVAGQQVMAKYDLLQIRDEEIQIFDWKTFAVRYSRTWLQKKIQTMLYPLVLCLAGANLSNDLTPPSPENVGMVYWFAGYPHDPEDLPYSRYQFEEDQQYIESLIRQIIATPSDHFKLTEDEKHCRYCNYRSLCERCPSPALPGEEKEISFANALEGLVASLENRLDETVDP